MTEQKYIFGPVASRRLGLSLGIDLTPSKTCSLNCVYCEAGKTTALTLERREYVPLEAVIRQLDAVLATSPQLDYLTFSGAGEPTLYSRLGELIEHIKSRYPRYRLCLLTNATLFGDRKLLDEIAGVDLVVPSLDASSPEEFAKINRPCPGLPFETFIGDLLAYGHERRQAMWLELFIVPGVNDFPASILRFRELVRQIRPDKVQLNTLDRPGCVDWIRPSDENNTRRFITVLEEVAPVEAVGPFRYRSASLKIAVVPEELAARIIELTERRPCTFEDLCLTVAAAPEVIREKLDALLAAGRLKTEKRERGDFFRPS